MVARFWRKHANLLILLLCAIAFLNAPKAQGQNTPPAPQIYAGRNINMVSGTRLPGETDPQRIALGGDPYLQRQNEPSIAVSARNPMHLLAGANDYRTVDMAGSPGEWVTGDSWLGLFKSFDGGQSWQSTLLPGFPQANHNVFQEGSNSPIHGFAAAADPTVRAGTNGLFYYSGIVFDRGLNALSKMFVARFIDLNNREGASFNVPKNEDPIKYIDTSVIDQGTAGQFMDKPWLAVDIPRAGAATTKLYINDMDAEGNSIQIPQSLSCGNAYVAYASFLGKPTDNPHTQVLVARSTDCGATWNKSVKVTESYQLNQGATLAIDPRNGDLYVAWQLFTNVNQPAAIMISRSTDFGLTFGKAVQVALTNPFNQGTRPATADDPFRLFRTNAFPTLAVDGLGRIYIAWSERGYWGNDNLEPKDNRPDGSRIVVTSSTDRGRTWAGRYAADTSDGCLNGQEPSQCGHQIMPSLSYAGGRLTLLFYNFRDDYYPRLFNSILNGVNPPYPLFDPSFPPADAAAFEPLPVRHTVEVYVAAADAAGDTPAHFGGSSQKVSRYLSTVVPDGSGGYRPLQLQSNPVNYPIFAGGTSPFIGDYIEIAASPTFIPDPSDPGKWIYNNAPADASVFHAVWTDNRNVMPPPAPEAGVDGHGNLLLVRPDWTKYSPPNFTAESPSNSCSPESWPGMRNQDIYTSRVTQGLVLGSYGNSKPLDIERAFSIFVENTIAETLPAPDKGYTPSSRYFRLSIGAPTGVSASFKPLLVTAYVLTQDIEVYSLTKVAMTVFAIATGRPNASLTVVAEEIENIGGSIKNGGLKSSLTLNPDPTNPVPLNVDDNDNPLANKETHDPEFIGFNCDEFATLPVSVLSNCLGSNHPSIVTKLVVQWPNLVDPGSSGLLNPALLNTTENPALLNPALLNPALLNPALLNPALLNPALLNPALLNPALLNPALLNPALLNPALLNPALLNPALLNSAPSGTDPFAVENVARSAILVHGSYLDPIGTVAVPATLTDLTWKLQNIGNDASSYLLAWYTGLSLKPEQILIYRTYKTPSADISSCLLNEAGLHYEFLVNILNPADLSPADLRRALAFSLAPEDHAYITLRFKDLDGQQGPLGVDPDQVTIGVTPEAANTGEAAATMMFLGVTPNPASTGEVVVFTATVFSGFGSPTSGTVTFWEGLTSLASDVPLISGKASFTTSQLTPGTHAITAEYNGADLFKLSSSIVTLVVTESGATMKSVVPSSAAAGHGQTVVISARGLSISGDCNPGPKGNCPLAQFRQNGISMNGYVFGTVLLPPSASPLLIVQLPFPGDLMRNTRRLASGPATVQLSYNGVSTDEYRLEVTRIPGTPVPKSVFGLISPPTNLDACGKGINSTEPITGITPGQGIAVSAYGIDTTGTTVIFRQSGTPPIEGHPACTFVNSAFGLASAVLVPNLVSGEVAVSIKTTVNGVTSAESDPIVLQVLRPATSRPLLTQAVTSLLRSATRAIGAMHRRLQPASAATSPR